MVDVSLTCVPENGSACVWLVFGWPRVHVKIQRGGAGGRSPPEMFVSGGGGGGGGGAELKILLVALLAFGFSPPRVQIKIQWRVRGANPNRNFLNLKWCQGGGKFLTRK